MGETAPAVHSGHLGSKGIAPTAIAYPWTSRVTRNIMNSMATPIRMSEILSLTESLHRTRTVRSPATGGRPWWCMDECQRRAGPSRLQSSHASGEVLQLAPIRHILHQIVFHEDWRVIRHAIEDGFHPILFRLDPASSVACLSSNDDPMDL